MEEMWLTVRTGLGTCLVWPWGSSKGAPRWVPHAQGPTSAPSPGGKDSLKSVGQAQLESLTHIPDVFLRVFPGPVLPGEGSAVGLRP